MSLPEKGSQERSIRKQFRGPASSAFPDPELNRDHLAFSSRSELTVDAYLQATSPSRSSPRAPPTLDLEGRDVNILPRLPNDMTLVIHLGSPLPLDRHCCIWRSARKRPLDHLRAPVPRSLAAAPLHMAVFPRRNRFLRRRTSPMRGMPPRQRQRLSPRLG